MEKVGGGILLWWGNSFWWGKSGKVSCFKKEDSALRDVGESCTSAVKNKSVIYFVGKKFGRYKS